MAKKAADGTKQSAARPGLNRERVLAAAVEIADENGVGSVTMRALASKLGVEAMSLYNHVRNKDDILDGMLDTVVGEIDLPADAGDWREAMRRRAVSAHEVFRRHPWVPVLLDSRESRGPASLRYLDWVLGTLIGAGFSIDEASRAFSLLDSYIYGFAIQEVNFSADGDASPEERAAAVAAYVPEDTYPHLHRMAIHASATGYDADADFAFGLEIILDGLGRILEGSREA